MSVVLPLLIIPVALLEDALGANADAADVEMSPAEEFFLVTAWFALPVLFAALHLVRYRGGATMLPLFGRSWISVLLSVVSLLLSALFLLAAFVGTEFPALDSLPSTIWLVAAAVYFQALRAAAVHRSLPDPEADLVSVFE